MRDGSSVDDEFAKVRPDTGHKLVEEQVVDRCRIEVGRLRLNRDRSFNDIDAEGEKPFENELIARLTSRDGEAGCVSPDGGLDRIVPSRLALP
jgi:hypothetical protein